VTTGKQDSDSADDGTEVLTDPPGPVDHGGEGGMATREQAAKSTEGQQDTAPD